MAIISDDRKWHLYYKHVVNSASSSETVAFAWVVNYTPRVVNYAPRGINYAPRVTLQTVASLMIVIYDRNMFIVRTAGTLLASPVNIKWVKKDLQGTNILAYWASSTEGTDTQHNSLICDTHSQHYYRVLYAEFRCAERRIFTVMLNVIRLCVVVLSVFNSERREY